MTYLEKEYYETFENQKDPNQKTYLPQNFSDESFRMINPPNYIQEMKGIKRKFDINKVLPATYPEEPDNFFDPLSSDVYNQKGPLWEKCQRPWIECSVDLKPLNEQHKRSQEDFERRKNSFQTLL